MTSPDASGGAPVTDLRRALSACLRPCTIPGMPATVPDPIATDIAGHPHLARLATRLAEVLGPAAWREVRPLSGGASAVVLSAGGQVIRLRIGPPVTRADLPEMLQADSAVSTGGLSAEILPRVRTDGITDADVQAMHAALAARGHRFIDPGTDNLGRTADGRLVVLDPGAVGSAPPPRESERAAAVQGRNAAIIASLRARPGASER